MKKITIWMLTGAIALNSLSCTTTYDAYGNPRQSVDPGTAAAGVVAAGIIGYAIANNRNNNHHGNNHGYSGRRGGYRCY
jgi:hypothetical protein